jgi:hypothetical protein
MAADYNERTETTKAHCDALLAGCERRMILREVREILGSTPGQTAVRLMFERPDGELLCLAVVGVLRQPNAGSEAETCAAGSCLAFGSAAVVILRLAKRARDLRKGPLGFTRSRII